MKTILLSTAALLGVLSTATAHAQPAAAPDVAGTEASNAVRGVIVTANRALAASAQVAQAVTVLDRPQIEASQAILLPDLLGRTAGVTLSRNGGPGGVTALRIRGAETDQTLGVLDGVRRPDVVDEKPGHVWDYARSTYKVWGLAAAPGTAQIYAWPDCQDGRVVADVVRINKGHTEGLEPKVTEAILDLIQSAPGGKARQGT